MPIYELHLFNKTEVALVPPKAGVFVLYQLENAIVAEGAGDLRKSLRAALKKFPAATHFATEILPGREVTLRAQKLKEELNRVRVSTFMGVSPGAR